MLPTFTDYQLQLDYHKTLLKEAEQNRLARQFTARKPRTSLTKPGWLPKVFQPAEPAACEPMLALCCA